MDDPMDYVYHNRSELHPNHNQLPYPQHSRCPYYNRADSSYISHPVFSPPLRSVGHGRYDPVHSSANPGHWHPGSQAQLPQWSGPGTVMGMPGAPPRHYPLHPAEPSQYRPPAGVSIIGPSMYAYPGQSAPHLPPVRSGYGPGPDPISHHSLPTPQTQALPDPNMFAHAGRGYANLPASRSSDPYNAALSSLPATSQNAPAPESSDPSTESHSAPEPPSRSSTLEPASQLGQTSSPPRNIQFGSQPLSPDRSLRPEPTSTSEPPAEADRVPSAPRLENIQFGSAPRLSTLVHPPAPGVENRAPASQASASTETLPHPPAAATAGSSNRPSGSSNTSLPPFQSPPERRRTTTAARRTFSRRQSPPPERHDEGDIRMFENFLAHNHRYLGVHDMDESRVRAAQFLRGSMSTKMVASSSAIRSLQSVAMSDLSESEKTCVICYNEFGVETPEGLKEAPLRLPQCKHIFGDHCIKKWFEESDSCPYCRDKMPSEPRITSANSMMNRHMNRGWRETDPTHRASDSGILPPGVGHGERRSPPTDSGESRRRTRARHSSGRGPGSPPFGASRPGSFGGSPSNDPTRRSLNFRSNHPSNVPHRVGAPPPFPYSIPMPTLAFGGPHDPTSSSTPGLYPPYTHHTISRGVPPIPQSGAFATHVNRNSLPTPGPGNWIIANPPRPEEQQRRNQPGDSIAVSQGNASSNWDSQ